MLVFSTSGTYIVDLKDTVSPAAKLSSRLLPDYLADFFATMIKMTQRTKLGQKKPADTKKFSDSDPSYAADQEEVSEEDQEP